MLRPGIYKHYKGNEYCLIGIAKHSETQEEMVVYQALYGEHEIWVRPLAMFEETVEIEGQTLPRFVWMRDENEKSSATLKPTVVVSVMVMKEGKVLLNFRKGSFSANMFGVAGGKLDSLESFQACAERECLEEAGVHIGPLRFVCVMNNVVHAPHHFVIVGVVTDWMSGEPQVFEPEKCESWGWYELDALPQPLTEVTRGLLEAYRTNKTYFDVVNV